MLDIGANMGTYSLVAAAFGYTARAFEALPRSVQAIQQTLCWNPQLRERLTLFPYALGEEDGTCEIVSDPSKVPGAVVCNDTQRAGHAAAAVVAEAHLVRLGEYLGAVRSDVMKISLEGSETMALRGAGASPLPHSACQPRSARERLLAESTAGSPATRLW